MTLKIGSLFSGTGALDMAVAEVFGAETAWFCEFNKYAAKILEHHWPDVPNHRDVSAVDWSKVEPVDIITGGSPCQDLSLAGKRRGMEDGTRSNLWVAMRDAIDALRPTYVVWENVRGALSAKAQSASDLELGDGQVGDGRVNLRALGRVLGDLAEMGYDAQWGVVRASDAGACHRRERVFVLAHAADAADEHGDRHPSARFAHHGPADGDCATAALTLLPTPQARDHKDGEIKPAAHRPQSKDSVNRAIAHLLPTPRSSDSAGPGRHGQGGLDLRTAASLLPVASQGGEWTAWGEYEAAIRRWEVAIARPAPAPTEPATKGGARLSPRFVEWMMGLPDGHVTDPEIGVSRTQQLKALGNGVVPQQAALALLHLLPIAGRAQCTSAT